LTAVSNRDRKLLAGLILLVHGLVGLHLDSATVEVVLAIALAAGVAITLGWWTVPSHRSGGLGVLADARGDGTSRQT
jgi:hypothetical protein